MVTGLECVTKTVSVSTNFRSEIYTFYKCVIHSSV